LTVLFPNPQFLEHLWPALAKGGGSRIFILFQADCHLHVLVSIAPRKCASAGGHLDNCKMHYNAFFPSADAHVRPHRNKDGGWLGLEYDEYRKGRKSKKNF
jgi:hypothetical protein